MEHVRLAGRLELVFEGIQLIRLYCLYLRASFFLQVNEWPYTYSSPTGRSYAPPSVPFGVTLRPCLVTNVDTPRDLLRLWPIGRRTGACKVPGQGITHALVAIVGCVPDSPLLDNPGLQDVNVLFLDLAISLGQACLSLECTVSPVLDLHLIIC